VAHEGDPISYLPKPCQFVVERKAMEDPVLLKNFEVPPEKICMFDLEGIQAGELIPWCAGLVLMNQWKLEEARMVYFAEAVAVAHEQGKTVGRNVMTYNEFRLQLESYAKQGYLMYVKGIAFEYRAIYDLFSSKSSPAHGRIAKDTYMSPSCYSPWRFVLHDLQCGQFNDLYLYYKDHIRISMDHQFLEDYAHMHHKGSGHVPVVECLYFLHHWRLTMSNLLVLGRYVSWTPVYLQQVASKEVNCRQMDMSIYMSYWDKRLRSLPPPLELFPVCFKGPGYDYAFTKLNARMGHFLFQKMEELEEKDSSYGIVNEEFKNMYGEYFLSITPFKVLLKKEGIRAPEGLDKLKPYGWTVSDVHNTYPELVEPNWWGSKERSLGAMDLRGEVDLSHALSWDKIVTGDRVELYAMVASTKEDYLKRVTDPIVLQGYREEALSITDVRILDNMIASSQRQWKLFYKEVHGLLYKELRLFIGRSGYNEIAILPYTRLSGPLTKTGEKPVP